MVKLVPAEVRKIYRVFGGETYKYSGTVFSKRHAIESRKAHAKRGEKVRMIKTVRGNTLLWKIYVKKAGGKVGGKAGLKSGTGGGKGHPLHWKPRLSTQSKVGGKKEKKGFVHPKDWF